MQSAPSGAVIDGGDKAGSTATPEPPATTWIVTFVPSPLLIERGIKVDVVRGRLTQIGRILGATPQVTSRWRGRLRVPDHGGRRGCSV